MTVTAYVPVRVGPINRSIFITFEMQPRCSKTEVWDWIMDLDRSINARCPEPDPPPPKTRGGYIARLRRDGWRAVKCEVSVTLLEPVE